MPYTYETLVEDIIANMEEDSPEFLAALPKIINRAQNYLQRRVNPVELLRFTSVSLVPVSREVPLPSDVRVVKAVEVEVSGVAAPLLQQTNEYLTAYWPDPALTGVPKYYATKDNAMLFVAPTPPEAYVVRLEYEPRVTALTSTEPTNWFSDNAENAFFAAAMMQSNTWTKNAEASQMWKAQADEELMAINNDSRRVRRSDTSDRNQGVPENNIGDGIV